MEIEFELIGGPFDGNGYLLDVTKENPKFSVAIPRKIENNKEFNTEMALYERWSHESRVYNYIGSEFINETEEQ